MSSAGRNVAVGFAVMWAVAIAFRWRAAALAAELDQLDGDAGSELTDDALRLTRGKNTPQHTFDLYKLAYKISRTILSHEAVEFGVLCGNCRRAIVGVLHKCIHCDGLDLCESCVVGRVHDSHHPLYKINVPIPAALLSTDNPSQEQKPAFSRKNDLRESLPFEAVENIKKRMSAQSRASNQVRLTVEIEALYDQFKCYSDTDLPGAADSQWAVYGAISAKNLRTILPSRYVSPLSPITHFLQVLYDSDQDGCTGFTDFVDAATLAFHTSIDTKIDWLLKFLNTPDPSAKPQSPADTFAELVVSYVELSRCAFADAISLHTDIKPVPPATNEGAWTHADDMSALLWDDRIEADSRALYNPLPVDPAVAADINVLWDVSAMQMAEDLYARPNASTAVLKQRILADSKLTSFVAALFETAIL